MVYCSRCGQKNPDEARFCIGCGKPLYEHPRHMEKRYEDRCDEECSGKQKTPLWTTFWVLFLVIIAAVLFLTLIQQIFSKRLPDWLMKIQAWDMCWAIVPLLAIIFIIYAIITSTHNRRY
jgi:uncharacterized membrane protein YvbJ